jgi:FKBP-type peptidyl-prolyl cis-trans isomerase FklB
MEKVSYALGLGIGRQLAQMGASELNIDDFAAAIKDVIAGNELKVSNQEAQTIVQEFFAKQEQELNAKKAEAGKTAKVDGEKFLAENANKEGVITLPSGLQYKVLQEGTGKMPKATDQVKCHYEGTLIDGTLFDSSIKRGQPAVFGVNQVIPGWVEALQLMPEGSKWKLFIPSELAYGAQGAGEMIPPHSTLVFEVELIEVL